MRVGYARVSTQDQNLNRQLDQLRKEGCERIVEEKVSGSRADRPELTKMLETIREGDVIVVTELSRLSRSVKELFKIVGIIQQIGAEIKSLKEPWLDTTTPQGRLLFTFFSGISEFERDLIRQRTLEGIAAACARGSKGGRPALDSKKVKLALKMYDSNTCTVEEITRATGVAKTTLYAYAKKRMIK